MSLLKSKLFFFILPLFIASTFVVVSCNDNASDESAPLPPEEAIDTSKMDTASTRPVNPVKTTN